MVSDMPSNINLPNLITIGRLVLVPVVLVAIAENRLDIAFWLFLIAGISDGVDGFIARRWNLRTELGAHLDPLADKALLIGIYITLSFAGLAPKWLMILIVSRDLAILGAILLAWFLHRTIEIRPLFISKATTAAQITLAALILSGGSFDWTIAPLLRPGNAVVAGLTVISGAVYLWNWLKLMSHDIDRP